MLGLTDMLEQIRKFDLANLSFLQILRLTALNLPDSLYRFMPLIMILASVTLFLNLARTSEMVVTRAAGRSALRSLVSPALVALALGALAVAVLNPIVAATSKQYEMLANRYSGTGTATLSLSTEALWLRQGGDDGQTVIRASGASLDGTELRGVTFLGFSLDGSPSYRIETPQRLARPRRLDAGQRQGVALRRRQRQPRARRGGARPDATALGPHRIDRIRDSFGTPSSIPIWELPRFIRQLEAAGFSARTHRVWLEMELATPLMLMAMVMIGAGFTIRHVRFGHSRADGAAGADDGLLDALHPQLRADPGRAGANPGGTGRLVAAGRGGAVVAGPAAAPRGRLMRRLLLILALCLPLPVRAQDSAALIADSVSVQGDNLLVASGAVEVLYGTARLRARRITYDRATGALVDRRADHDDRRRPGADRRRCRVR